MSCFYEDGLTSLSWASSTLVRSLQVHTAAMGTYATVTTVNHTQFNLVHTSVDSGLWIVTPWSLIWLSLSTFRRNISPPSSGRSTHSYEEDRQDTNFQNDANQLQDYTVSQLRRSETTLSLSRTPHQISCCPCLIYPKISFSITLPFTPRTTCAL